MSFKSTSLLCALLGATQCMASYELQFYFEGEEGPQQRTGYYIEDGSEEDALEKKVHGAEKDQNDDGHTDHTVKRATPKNSPAISIPTVKRTWPWYNY